MAISDEDEPESGQQICCVPADSALRSSSACRVKELARRFEASAASAGSSPIRRRKKSHLSDRQKRPQYCPSKVHRRKSLVTRKVKSQVDIRSGEITDDSLKKAKMWKSCGETSDLENTDDLLLQGSPAGSKVKQFQLEHMKHYISNEADINDCLNKASCSSKPIDQIALSVKPKLKKPIPPEKPARLRLFSPKSKKIGPPVLPKSSEPRNILAMEDETFINRTKINTQNAESCINQNDTNRLDGSKHGSDRLILNRSILINEDIKKPVVKPPPPPVVPVKPSFITVDPDNIETNIIGFSSSDRLASDRSDNMSISYKSDGILRENSRIFKRLFDSDKIPSAPTIPPPTPPLLSPISFDDSVYEEIEQTMSFQDNISDSEDLSYSNDFSERKSINRQTRSMISEINDEKIDCTEAKNINSTIGNTKETGKKSSAKRPISSIEFDKLLRIKSDIHFNITKKVGQIKLKVSSSSQEKQRRERALSMFYVNPNELKTDDKLITEVEFPLDDQYIYGDDWSTDDEDDSVLKNKSIEEESNTILAEIEKELNVDFKSSLPDVIPKFDSPQLKEKEQDPLSIKCNKSKERASNLDSSKSSGNESNNSTPVKAMTSCETVSPSSNTSKNTFKESVSDYTMNEVDRSIYTPRVIRDPQPLYQIYMMEQLANVYLDCQESDEGVAVFVAENIEDNFKVRRNSSSASTDSGRGGDCSTTISHITSNTSMRRDRLTAISHYGSQRSLWCELPEVKNSGLLDMLDDETKKLQEAYFEVITSEASYLRSLNILITHFMAAPELLGSKGTSSIISNEERKRLFSNIFSVRDCSERLLSDLESRLEFSLVLNDVCDILIEHFSSNFDSYVKYCSNQVYQDRTLKKLKNENGAFVNCIQRLENDRLCQGLDMRSFLMLPMQRVTRYPLLVIAILQHTTSDSDRYKNAQIALHYANQVVSNCNEGARRMERTEQLLEIEKRLIYKSPSLKRIPLVSSGRYLVKRGMLTHFIGDCSKKFLHNKQLSRSIYFFLFSDIIMITKKKMNGSYVCKDYCTRRFIDIEPLEPDNPRVSGSLIVSLPMKFYLFSCTLMHNSQGRQVELLLNADSESDRERWLSALRPPACSNPEEKIYADWDCPQAVAVHDYTASQTDELPLKKGDLINVLRKMPDGWFYGEKVHDDSGGWFPSSYTQQVLNDHVRAKNYRRRLRVIQAAADFRLQQEQLKAVQSGSQRKQSHLIERFRRMSNPKSILH